MLPYSTIAHIMIDWMVWVKFLLLIVGKSRARLTREARDGSCHTHVSSSHSIETGLKDCRVDFIAAGYAVKTVLYKWLDLVT